jgi:glycosyltransferase involved in cell wall biosynthesis
MVPERPFVSVIIPTYRDWDRLETCLNALLQQSYPAEDFEVIVVNNDPATGPGTVAQRFSQVTFLTEPEAGSYAARNTGIKHAQGEVLAFTDADCIPSQRWLAVGVDALESGVERVGGKVEVFTDHTADRWGAFHDRAFAFPQVEYVRKGGAVTANMICRRRLFDEVGLFDDSLLSGADLLWGRKAAASGHRVAYRADMVVRHPARAWGEVLAKSRRVTSGIAAANREQLMVRRFRIVLHAAVPPMGQVLRAWRERRVAPLECPLALLLAWRVRLAGLPVAISAFAGRGE